MLFKVNLPQWGSGSATVHIDGYIDVSSMLWEVRRVVERPKDKRRNPIDHEVDTDSYSYRKLNMNERTEYRKQFFVELLGIDTHKDVLRQAWMQSMPDALKED